MHITWKEALKPTLESEHFRSLQEFISAERKSGVNIYPPDEQVFTAFELCPFDKVKVVLLGQDPYHGPGQAHGLSFSVQDGIKIPASLRNIFREISREFQLPKPDSGNLSYWASQGVLLLNASLTVQGASPGSHMQKWEAFTDAVIRTLSDQREGLIFLLWGGFAHKKEKLINTERGHQILKWVHPVARANRFADIDHFRLVNEFLRERGQTEIDWRQKPNPDN